MTDDDAAAGIHVREHFNSAFFGPVPGGRLGLRPVGEGGEADPTAAFEASKRWCSTIHSQCYTRPVPTTKPRYTLTDTGELSKQLDRAQRRWPEVRDRKVLLLKLAAAGREAIEREADERGRAVAETAGALSGVYEPGELEHLRQDWPA